ncbi:Activator of 2-hydroxyglutaryl-CoA dehydratase [hydrothermal vent metagenome]|uniref:Activator of 2-hydroxyglutaryl-CoA dehydratase n=1 Tax=hydrothermal vent metagenome TaxID=652676 RepID=A0A3B1C0S8_9ZZZZ
MRISPREAVWLGLDIGSVSVKGSAIDSGNNVLATFYTRSHGQPIEATIKTLKSLLENFNIDQIKNLGVTGTAGELIASLTGGEFTNEIVAQSQAVSTLYPHIRTLVEMGGEDSKMLMFKEEKGETVLEDFSMNNLCAAGTGSFLDQQASRMGFEIEDQFGAMALKSKKPPRIAGRCSVFAKSDMIHLQQIGAPDYEIIAGLCAAVARSFVSNVGRGKEFHRPVAFFGGVAANAGVARALAVELGMEPDKLFIPKNHAVTGAIGAALASKKSGGEFIFKGVENLSSYHAVRDSARGSMTPLVLQGKTNDKFYNTQIRNLNGDIDIGAYIGIDIGSLSTNVVAIDKNRNVLARRYIRTQSRPIEAVTRGLLEIGKEIGDKVKVMGVGTTGSGRYMIGDFVGADIVRNEITAQATAAVHFIPDADTIFEIGGQDSKYISIEGGAVVDFEMNKVCAAGTGSFIEEQAEKIDLNIEKEFAETAFDSVKPGKFGDRCTVFIESDLVSSQQKGMSKQDLAAGLAYSIVSNYLLRVVGDRRIGKKVLFQGGVAWNKAVVAAFESITGKKIIVPPHHDVTGAIGAAIIASKHHEKMGLETGSSFIGFDLRNRKYRVTSFECKACDNVCSVSRVKFETVTRYYGARCEIFDKKDKKKKKKEKNRLPDLYAMREHLLFGDYVNKKKAETNGKPLIGIPRALYFYEHFPFWQTFFSSIDLPIILSGKTNPKLIHDSVEQVKAEMCFPIKVMHGHVIDLIEKGADYVFLPAMITVNDKKSKFSTSHTCPLVQSTPSIIKSAIDLAHAKVKLLEPTMHFQRGDSYVAKELKLFSTKFGVPQSKIKQAIKKARKAQNQFYLSIKELGAKTLKDVQARGENPVVIISRPYNGCDSGINMDLPKKLLDMGKVPFPIDFLDLSEERIHKTNPDMYWRSGQRMMAAAQTIRNDANLDAIFISNFKCGPDSFIDYHVKEHLGGKPCLNLEIDEHSADAGIITRCEAFFDSLDNVDTIKFAEGYGHHEKPHTEEMECGAPPVGSSNGNGYKKTIYIPYMCDHVYTLSAALRASGTPSDVLPVSDQESMDLGLKHSSGKECIPYTITTGDIVKKVMEPGFDREKSAFLMPTTAGPCRFGQYQSVQRMVLDELGMPDVPLLSPDADIGYGELGDLGPRLKRAAWRGIVTVDILTKLLHKKRPYEVNPGETERVYKECLDGAISIVENDSAGLFDYMPVVRDRFRAISVKKENRPVIGVVGEIYLRSHAFSNRDIVRRIEALGGEVWVSPIGEWMLYCTEQFKENARIDKKYLDLFKGYMQDRIQKKDEHKLYEPFHDTLVNGVDASTIDILKNAAPYVPRAFEGEAILSIGKAIDFAESGLAGVAHILPFSCMPGTVVTAISKKIREDYDNIPWLNLDYDSVEETGSQTRLEAFMYQAKQFREQTTESVV